MKWWADKQTAYHKLHQATVFALDQIDRSQALEDSPSADDCCPKCGRRMDFWPEEVDRPDEPDESKGAGESGFSGESGESGIASGFPESGWDDFPSGAD